MAYDSKYSSGGYLTYTAGEMYGEKCTDANGDDVCDADIDNYFMLLGDEVGEVMV